MRICCFASGSKGNCTLVSVNGMNFLVDAGISMRRICANLSLCSICPDDIDGIFITHQHSDHVCGLKMLARHFEIPVYAPRTTVRYLIDKQLCPDKQLNIFPVGDSIAISNVKITSFATSHDTDESVGYRFEGDKVFSIATDTGIVTDDILTGLRGADAVIIESNHDLDMLRFGDYPYHLKRRILSHKGHLSNDDCARLAVRLCEEGTKYIILGHLSRENNTPDKAFSAVNSAISGRGAQLYVAPEAERFSLEIGGEQH